MSDPTNILDTLPDDKGQVWTPKPVMSEDLAAKEFPPISWAIPGFVPEGVTLLAGKPKMGKSWMALNMAVAKATNGYALGTIQVDQCEVMYLALEDNERRLKKRMDLVSEGKTPKGIHFFTSWPRMDDGGLDALDEYIEANNAIQFVVIDTLAKIKPNSSRNSQYEADYAAVGDIHHIAHKRGIAILIIHHLKKQATDDPMDQISGTLGLTGAADGMLVLQRDRGNADAQLHVTGRDIEEDGSFSLSWDQSKALWTLLGTTDDVNRSEGRQGIVELLREYPSGLTGREISEYLDRDDKTVKTQLWRMNNDGEISTHSKGGGLPNLYVLNSSLMSVTPVTTDTAVTPVTPVTPPPQEVTQVTGVTGNTNRKPWEYSLKDMSGWAKVILPTHSKNEAERIIRNQFGKDRVLGVREIGNV